jgi:hypothetical protein
MKRAFVFVIVGPMALALIASLAVLAPGAPPDVAWLVAVAMFFLTLPVALVAGSVDELPARACPIPLRASLIAIVGATIAYAVAYTLLGWVLPTPDLFLAGGAIGMGVCSLLAHDYGGGQRSAVSAGP